jgi:hypothetical protein
MIASYRPSKRGFFDRGNGYNASAGVGDSSSGLRIW